MIDIISSKPSHDIVQIIFNSDFTVFHVLNIQACIHNPIAVLGIVSNGVRSNHIVSVLQKRIGIGPLPEFITLIDLSITTANIAIQGLEIYFYLIECHELFDNSIETEHIP
jgi:hypothetical protein